MVKLTSPWRRRERENKSGSFKPAWRSDRHMVEVRKPKMWEKPSMLGKICIGGRKKRRGWHFSKPEQWAELGCVWLQPYV